MDLGFQALVIDALRGRCIIIYDDEPCGFVVTHRGLHAIDAEVDYDNDCIVCVDEAIEQWWTRGQPTA